MYLIHSNFTMQAPIYTELQVWEAEAYSEPCQTSKIELFAK